MLITSEKESFWHDCLLPILGHFPRQDGDLLCTDTGFGSSILGTARSSGGEPPGEDVPRVRSIGTCV